MKPMKTAVVGCGAISDIYLQNMIQRFSCLEVVSCCAKHRSSAEKKAAQYGLQASTLDAICADPSIELIVNLTPATEHTAIIRQALEAGKHVYTEKVLTADFEEAKELLALADARGLRLGCAPDTFLGGALQTARWALDGGMIGEVTSVQAFVNRDMLALYPVYRFTTTPGAGIGFDLGIYYLTALLSLLGPVQEVCGMTTTRHPFGVFDDPSSPDFGQRYAVENEDQMMAVLSFASGVLGTLHFSGTSIFPECPGIWIYGTQGILRLPDPNGFGGELTLQQKGMQTPVVLPLNHGFCGNSRGLGCAELAWAVRQNRPHRARAQMAVHAVEVLNAIVQSSQTKRHQTVETRFERPAPLPVGHLDQYVQTNPESALIL